MHGMRRVHTAAVRQRMGHIIRDGPDGSGCTIVASRVPGPLKPALMAGVHKACRGVHAEPCETMHSSHTPVRTSARRWQGATKGPLPNGLFAERKT